MVCAPGFVKSVHDDKACCQVPKCIRSTALAANAHAGVSAMLFGPSFSTVYDGDYYGDGDVSIAADSKSNAKADASAKQDTKADVSVEGDSDSGVSTQITSYMPSITVGSNAGKFTFF